MAFAAPQNLLAPQGRRLPRGPEPLGAGTPAQMVPQAAGSAQRGHLPPTLGFAASPAVFLLPASTPSVFRPIWPRCTWNFDRGSNKAAAAGSLLPGLSRAGSWCWQTRGGGGAVLQPAPMSPPSPLLWCCEKGAGFDPLPVMDVADHGGCCGSHPAPGTADGTVPGVTSPGGG